MTEAAAHLMWCHITLSLMAYLKRAWWIKLYSIFHEMQEREILPNVVTYSSIIYGLCKAQAMEHYDPWILLLRKVERGG
uniref:Pentatricopeptide repeat-containing protein n=1 Tax=Arundo donax TaxID=35708 RepID=A0A0A9GR11_ARUDO